ncbi:hypothetical protein E2I00_005845 [Balaenoptera physalus]|uniref:Uncharacterized protein n=1 Tax=Balaenoptera physalus TaxID=9770 RepID=A0A643C8K9_BALPH|nr:hypothetical protein E2I00_005845 [Balaenoptera physalus]
MAGQGDRYYTYTELLAIARRFRQNPNELLITWILRVELVMLGDLTGDAVFNYRCKALRGDGKTLLAWLLLAWRQRWESFLHFEGTELPFRPWTTMEEGIQLVRELGMLDWIYREPPPLPEPEWLVPEDAVMVIQTVADVGLLWRQSQPGRARLMLGPNPTRKDLMGWLLSHGMPKARVEKQPTKEPQRGVSLPPAHPVGVTSQSWHRTGSWLVAAGAGCQSLLRFSLLHFGPMGMTRSLVPQTAAWCLACGEGRAASWVAGRNAAVQVRAWDGLVCDEHR